MTRDVAATDNAAASAPADRPRASARIGAVHGIPIYIGSSWLLIGALFTIFMAGPISGSLPELGLRAYLVAFFLAVLLLFSVLVHEYAHAVSAHLLGYKVERIVADFIGGHTVYRTAESSPPTPGRMAIIAALGPLANLAIAVLAMQASSLPQTPLTSLLLAALMWTNAAVALINLLPGLPLDGGHVVEAIIWKITGRRCLGTLIAGWLGRGVVVGLAVYVLVHTLPAPSRLPLSNVLVAAILAAYLWFGATQAINAAGMMNRLERVQVGALIRPVRIVSPTTPLSSAYPQALGHDSAHPGEPTAIVIVADPARPREPVGFLDEQAAAATLATGAGQAPASSCLRACPAQWVVDVEREQVNAADLVRWMNERGSAQLALRSQDGVYGVVEAVQLAAAMPSSPRWHGAGRDRTR